MIAINHGSEPIGLRRGERIAQLVFQGFIVDTVLSRERAQQRAGLHRLINRPDRRELTAFGPDRRQRRPGPSPLCR